MVHNIKQIIKKMGVLRLMGTLINHCAIKDALIENVPTFECLLVDYNANIHYILQKTITELNEILYYTYYREKNDTNVVPIGLSQIPEQNDYGINLELSIDELDDRMDKYNQDYGLGVTYNEIHKKLSSMDAISDIVFHETIEYTRLLICSLNKGQIKKVFISLDGAPSMAKIKEQRNRRYIGAHLNNIKENIVKKYKLKNNNIYQIDLFYYRSMICTGTTFMDKIQQALFHLDIDLDIEVSTINIKGEGEMKIIHAIKELDNYDSYCIMSPDSDMLILVGLLSNYSKFDGKKFYNFRIDYQNKNQYQFFDLRQLIGNFQKYFSDKIGTMVSSDKMLELFFMLVVFGNDFLPKLEPLDIKTHFDFVCECCLKLSCAGLQFRKNGNLNYEYLLEFLKLVNKNVIEMSIEKSLSHKYNNYDMLCKKISISELDLKNSLHHKDLQPFKINYLNFGARMKILNISYTKLLNFMKETTIRPEHINHLYKDIHQNFYDSYLLLVLPRLLRFPGCDDDRSFSGTNYEFFEKFVKYMNAPNNISNNYHSLKFRNKLMPREFKLIKKQTQGTVSMYMAEMEKLNKSLEPYRSIFRMTSINLVSFDLFNSQLTDNRDKYYDTYVKIGITKREIETLVIDYIMGIEWLYKYYITNDHLEWSGWQYNHTQPPLMDDIIKYLETNKGNQQNQQNQYVECQQQIVNRLKSCPENTLSPQEHYYYITPNEYTNANKSPNLADVIHLIDGNGAVYLNKCQIRWHELDD